MTDEPKAAPFNVLFLCTGNSARSIMAECIMNRLGGETFRGFSAGSQPKSEVHPCTLDLLRRMNFDVTGVRSKSWTEFAGPDAPKLGYIITVCDNAAAETCPVWPGQPMTAHWGIADPAVVTGTDTEIRLAFAHAFRLLNNRISMFVNLPFRFLDPPALLKRIEAIGRMRDDLPVPGTE
jgi:arsenate reductase (thioredoxin)